MYVFEFLIRHLLLRGHIEKNGDASAAAQKTKTAKEDLEPSITLNPSDKYNTKMNPGETSGESFTHST